MKKTYSAIAPFALAAATLSACAGGVVTTPALIDDSYDPNNLAYIVKRGPVFTEIIDRVRVGAISRGDEESPHLRVIER